MLRLRRAWRRDPLPDRPARPAVHGRGQGTGRQGRDGGARARPARRRSGPSARPASTRSWRPPQHWFAEQLDGVEGGAARAYLEEPRDRREATSSAFGFGFAPDSRGKLKTALKELGEDKLVETGLLIKPEEGDEGQLRPLPRPADVPDPRRARPGDRVRRAHPRRRASPNISTRPTRRCSTRAAPSTTSTAPARPAAQARRLIVVEGYMDVIALDRAGIAEAVAPQRHRAHRGAARAALAARPPRRSLLRRRRGRAEGGGARRAARPAPSRPRALAALRHPARRARIPTTSSARAAAPRSKRCSTRPSRWSSASGGTSVEAAPLDTPEAARRPQAAADRPCRRRSATPTSRQLYRDELLRTVRRAGPPAAASRSLDPRRDGSRHGGRFVPAARAGRGRGARDRPAGIDRATARALVLGHAPVIPTRSATMPRRSRALPIADRAAARLRDRMVDLGDGRRKCLIGEASIPYWRPRRRRPPGGASAEGGDIGFSFTRRDARSGARAARSGSRDRDVGGQGRDRRGTRSGDGAVEGRGDEAAFEEQQRLRAARDEADKNGWRLAAEQ